MSRGKEPKKVWVYKNYQLVRECKSLTEAAASTMESISTVRIYLDKPKATRRGFVFVSEPLTQDEMQHMPIKEEKKQEPRSNSDCKVELGNLEFEVACSDHQVFHLERSKEARKAQLRHFIYTKLYNHWMIVPKNIVLLEKRFLQEILDSL
mgnify:CR=1 FL=1